MTTSVDDIWSSYTLMEHQAGERNVVHLYLSNSTLQRVVLAKTDAYFPFSHTLSGTFQITSECLAFTYAQRHVFWSKFQLVSVTTLVAELFQMAIQEQLRQKRRMMTWHNRNCLLAQCKSKTNLPWQVQLSWRDPTGISNTLTSQIKTTAWRICPPRVREKNNKKHWWFECLSKSWRWLHFNGQHFWVRCLALPSLLFLMERERDGEREREKKHIKKRTMRSNRDACLKIWRGQTVSEHPTNWYWEITILQPSC